MAQQTTLQFHLLKIVKWSAGPLLISALQTTEQIFLSRSVQWSAGTFPPSAIEIVPMLIFSLGTSSKKVEQANLPGGGGASDDNFASLGQRGESSEKDRDSPRKA